MTYPIRLVWVLMLILLPNVLCHGQGKGRRSLSNLLDRKTQAIVYTRDSKTVVYLFSEAEVVSMKKRLKQFKEEDELLRKRLHGSSEGISSLFKQFDLDRNASLEAKEVSRLGKLYKSYKQVNDADADENGKVSMAEFLRWTLRNNFPSLSQKSISEAVESQVKLDKLKAQFADVRRFDKREMILQQIVEVGTDFFALKSRTDRVIVPFTSVSSFVVPGDN